jgi:hypothetical protein
MTANVGTSASQTTSANAPSQRMKSPTASFMDALRNNPEKEQAAFIPDAIGSSKMKPRRTAPAACTAAMTLPRVRLTIARHIGRFTHRRAKGIAGQTFQQWKPA